MALFRAATVIGLGNGESTLFWSDRWINGSSVKVAKALPGSVWTRHIAGPISLQLLLEFNQLCDLLQHVQLQQRLTLSTGSLWRAKNTSRHRRTGRCSSALRQCLAPSTFGRRTPRQRSASSSDWSCMNVAGQYIIVFGMAYSNRTFASFVIKHRKCWINFCPSTASAGKSGTSGCCGCICSFANQTRRGRRWDGG